MKRQGFHQQPNQSQSEVHPSHGWMQSATVREIPKQEKGMPENVEDTKRCN